METPPIQHQMTLEEYKALQDADQLRILATLNLVYGILAFLCSGVFTIYIFMGYQMATNPRFFSSPSSSPTTNASMPPPEFGMMFVIMGVLGMVFVWVLGGLALHAAKCIRERRNWTWVMVSACLDCLHMPIGTALGVFTIIVINRPSVRALFDAPLRP